MIRVEKCIAVEYFAVQALRESTRLNVARVFRLKMSMPRQNIFTHFWRNQRTVARDPHDDIEAFGGDHVARQYVMFRSAHHAAVFAGLRGQFVIGLRDGANDLVNTRNPVAAGKHLPNDRMAVER